MAATIISHDTILSDGTSLNLKKQNEQKIKRYTGELLCFLGGTMMGTGLSNLIFKSSILQMSTKTSAITAAAGAGLALVGYLCGKQSDKIDVNA